MSGRKAPVGAIIYQKALRGCSIERKRIVYQATILILTFFTYAAYHAAKRPMTVVKAELAPNCTKLTEKNDTCQPWPPFDTKNSKEIFGLLDCAFLMSYALAMFVSGYIAEHTNLRIYLSVGMILTGFFTSMFGMAYYWGIHKLSYFFLINILTGVTQSTGWPCVVESVGSWFPEGRRGFIMGLWNTHTSVGNIVGSAIAAAYVQEHWGLSFIVPGIIIAGIGVIVFFFLVPDPSLVGMETNSRGNGHSQRPPRRSSLVSPNPIRTSSDSEYNSDTNEEQSQAIGLWGALKIPGVIEYSGCLFFAKLVSYTFLFWLPFYITNIKIGGKNYNDSKAADLAILFDVGGAIGGVAAGFFVDFTRCPGITNVTMLILAAPFLFLFKFHGTTSIGYFTGYMMISGFFVNGPYALITTAVSASLGTHECLQGNTKAMAVVTSIIDATGSLGAAIGPLLAGVISSSSWDDVFYMLIACDIIAALLLIRQVTSEVKQLIQKRRDRYLFRPYKSQKNTNETEPLYDSEES